MEITAINNLPMAAAPNGAGDVVPSPETHEEKRYEPPDDMSSANKETAGNTDMAVNQKELEKTIVNINKMIESMDTSLQFYIHKDSGRIAVKVINNKSKEVILEIPSEEILNLAAKLNDTTGLIIDKKI